MKKLKKSIYLSILLVLISVFSFGVEVPEKVYSLFVGPYVYKDVAQSQMDALGKVGFSEMSVVSEGEEHFVKIGEYSYFMDAFLCKEDIIKQFGISVTIEPTNNLEDKTTFTAQPRLSKIFKHKEGILKEFLILYWIRKILIMSGFQLWLNHATACLMLS